jgi:hypothetical protein
MQIDREIQTYYFPQTYLFWKVFKKFNLENYEKI